jgi:uncharacterized protein YgbK (DUF1537 family)
MVELLVLADDFTGALDAGVQFAQQSIPTLVSTRIELLDQGVDEEISAVVLDLETRHLSPMEAAGRVRQAVQLAQRRGVASFYKKTDSTLRGNVGSELAALLEATGTAFLALIPAYPKNGRITIAGRQYIDGVPLHLSPYGQDPQNPVSSSHVPDIIASQTSIPVHVVEPHASLQLEWLKTGGNRIVVFDARTDEDLRLIAEKLKHSGLSRVTAGCAGFAEQLPSALDLKRGAVSKCVCPSQLLLVCGSTNRISLEQIEAAAQSGLERIALHPGQLLDQARMEDLFERYLWPRIREKLAGGGDLILQTARGEADPTRFHQFAQEHGLQAQAVPRLVVQALGDLVGRILRFHGGLTPVVFGGDTAFAVMETLGLPKVLPIEQIAHGVVVSKMINASIDLPLITKAGGFGPPTLVQEIQRFVS